jgi:hypothetical protein
MRQDFDSDELFSIRVHVVERGTRARSGWIKCVLGENLKFSMDSLASYFFTKWEPVVFDALLLAAAVEFCDKSRKRPALGWGRTIELHVPVHSPTRWNEKSVRLALQDALEFLTGDRWEIVFYKRKSSLDAPQQGLFELPSGTQAVMPFSDGLDSRAVSALLGKKYGDALVRVRLGSKNYDQPLGPRGRKLPFKNIPYKIKAGKTRFSESTARSRGFKFALLSGIAAYMAKAPVVIVPESGQGALGPALIPVGQAYEDYRNHPLFTARMSAFLKALLSYDVQFEFPRLWFTKGETLAEYVALGNPAEWKGTRSCWQDNRHVSVDGHRRQCGVCAACMLRRMSMHFAGLRDPSGTYVWDDLSQPDFARAVPTEFKHVTRAQRHYAIAGALHLEHLAGLRHSPLAEGSIDLSVFQLSRCWDVPEADIRPKLDRLLQQHEKEWADFMTSLGASSFITDWVEGRP